MAGGGGHIRSAAPSAASLRCLEDADRSHRARYSGEGRGTGGGRRRAGRSPWRRRRVRGAADRMATAGRRCGRSAVRPQCRRRRVGGAAGRQCGSRAGGCESAVRRAGRSAAVVAAAGRWCGHCGGGGTSVMPTPWWPQRVGGAAAVVAVARRRCGRCGGGGGSALRRVGGASAVMAAARHWCGRPDGGVPSVLRQQWWGQRVRDAVAVVAAACAQCRWSAKWLPCWRLRVGGAAGPACGHLTGAGRQ